MPLPVTRYYGSKRKLVERIWEALCQNNIEFDSVLDIFGGTGIVSYFMAKQGKRVIYNDILSFNCEIARALLCTQKGAFAEKDAKTILHRGDRFYENYISDYFQDIYYTDEENEIIDTVIQNIPFLEPGKQASAYYILFQSCMIKRPFNLFHRRNLNLRTNFTHANFGNKVTWEKKFNDLFIKFTKELNLYQFDELPDVKISNTSALSCEYHADLIYIDTPYFPKKNIGSTTYHNRYHFLEGLMHYEDIPNYIDTTKTNREIVFGKNPEFETRSNYLFELDQLIQRHRQSIIALSYTTEGFPSVEELEEVIKRYKGNVAICKLGKHSFALNRDNAQREEVLILGY